MLEVVRDPDVEGPVQADTQVVEHGLRHLAWLAKDDPVVSHELSPAWKQVLASYVPEPFRNLG